MTLRSSQKMNDKCSLPPDHFIRERIKNLSHPVSFSRTNILIMKTLSDSRVQSLILTSSSIYQNFNEKRSISPFSLKLQCEIKTCQRLISQYLIVSTEVFPTNEYGNLLVLHDFVSIFAAF